MGTNPFDAVLVVAFGGPGGPEDVRPFLDNVLRGRRVSPARVEEVAHHYDLFGGISPLTALTTAQAEGLRQHLRLRGCPLPVYVGMRNWHPFVAETMAEMSRAGISRAVGFIAAPHRSYSSCAQYRENVRDARTAVVQAGLRDIDVTYVGDWHTHPDFVEASADRVVRALRELPEVLQPRATLVFTAHSIPGSMAARYPYEHQYRESADLIAQEVRTRTGFDLPQATVYQSRSGRPEDPWLGPDICEYLKSERARLDAVVVCPAGFLCDHIEVLYDLDVEAAQVAQSLDLPFVRAQTVNDHPAFTAMMADVVLEAIAPYRGGVPLPLIGGAAAQAAGREA